MWAGEYIDGRGWWGCSKVCAGVAQSFLAWFRRRRDWKWSLIGTRRSVAMQNREAGNFWVERSVQRHFCKRWSIYDWAFPPLVGDWVSGSSRGFKKLSFLSAFLNWFWCWKAHHVSAYSFYLVIIGKHLPTETWRRWQQWYVQIHSTNSKIIYD